MASETKAAHTPTPWHRNIPPAVRYPVIFAGRNTHVAQVIGKSLPYAVVEANLDFVIQAVNNHDALVSALHEARLQLQYLNERYQTGTTTTILTRIEAILSAVEG